VARAATAADAPLQIQMHISAFKRHHRFTTLSLDHGHAEMYLSCDAGSIALVILKDVDDLLVMRTEEEMAAMPPVTTAAVAFSHPTFQRMFPKQLVGDNQSVEIERVTLVFTYVVCE